MSDAERLENLQNALTEGHVVDPMRERRERQAAGLCAECGKRRGRITWGDTLAFTHGWAEKRCGVCVYWPQLLHALGRTAAIPGLIGKLAWALLTEHRA